MNSCLSFSLKYHPLQHTGCVERFKSPSTQLINGLVISRSKSRSKYSIKCTSEKCSSESSFHLTNNQIIRDHKPLHKSTVALAFQDGYVSKSEDAKFVSLSFQDVLIKKLDAFYRLSRPFAWASIAVGILSCCLLPVQSVTDLTPKFFIEIVKATVPAIVMNIFVAAINQLSDVEIDKINKPYLPLASGDISIGEGVAIAVISTLTSLAMGIMLRSPPIVIGLVIWWIVGAAYSIDLPLCRWKGSPLMASVSLIVLNGLLFQFPYFVHVQKYVLGRPVVFTKPLLFAAVFMSIFNVAITFIKDLPDVEGDRENGLKTLPIMIGRERVFSISVNMLLMAYGAAVLVGASSTILTCKLVTMIGHSGLAFLLWRRAQNVDLTEPKSMLSFYMFIFQLHYVEFFLMHFVR